MATENPIPVGEPYARVYLQRGVPTADSPRFRTRLAAYCTEAISTPTRVDYKARLAAYLTRELGVVMPISAGRYSGAALFREGELPDVLSAITFVYRFLNTERDRSFGAKWLGNVARVFREENVAYRLDGNGGVHDYIDEEFERSRVSALAVLQAPVLGNALHAYEAAYRHLSSDSRDTKAAVRSMFETVEIVARQLCPDAKNLNRWLAKNTLRDVCIAAMAGDPTQEKVLAGVFDALGEWVEAIHMYRHGQPADVPVAPSEEFAVYILSTGSAHLRLLAQCLLRISVGTPA